MDPYRLVIIDILKGGSSQVTFPVEVNFKFFSDQGPNSDIELSLLIKERTLYVLLDDPVWVFFTENEVGYLFSVFENLDTLTLI